MIVRLIFDMPQLKVCRLQSIGMKQLFDEELPKTRVNAAKKVFFLTITTYKKLITGVKKAKMTTKKEPRAHWLLNSYDVLFGENKNKLM
ncbi:KRAB-A domain-containing protein 2 [Trichonephila clavipes]|nr:KRAB-A domain-containing protein 2 [Trichonephila clavipes]